MKTTNKLKLGLVMGLALLLLVVVAQNAGVTTVRFLVWEWTASQILLLGAAALIGFVAGFLLGKLSGRGSPPMP